MMSNPEKKSLNLHQMFRRLLPVQPAHTPDLAWKFNSSEQKRSLILHKCQSNIRGGNKVLDWYNFARPALWRKRLNWKLTIAAIAHFGAWSEIADSTEKVGELSISRWFYTIQYWRGLEIGRARVKGEGRMSITRRIPDPTHPTRTQYQFTGSFFIIIHTKLSKDIQYSIIADIN